MIAEIRNTILGFGVLWSRDTVVAIVTMLLAGWFWVRIAVGARYFSLLQNTYKVGNLVISWGPGLDVNLSPSSNAEVKKEVICTSDPVICLQDMDKSNLTCLLL